MFLLGLLDIFGISSIQPKGHMSSPTPLAGYSSHLKFLFSYSLHFHASQHSFFIISERFKDVFLNIKKSRLLLTIRFGKNMLINIVKKSSVALIDVTLAKMPSQKLMFLLLNVEVGFEESTREL